ncbi:MAG: adenylosuccinate lyase [bacterium]
MIERYTLPEMGRVWTEENKFRKWLDVELAVCEAWAKLGKIPRKSLENIRAKAGFSLKRIAEIENEVDHDVIAFLTSVAECVGAGDARYIHVGLTSSDVLDTATALLLVESADILLKRTSALGKILYAKAKKHKNSVMIGRTHGAHAEPTTFGLKLLLWYDDVSRDEARLRRARDEIAVGKISGPVGTYSNVPPEVERLACESLGIAPASISTQVVQRDRHAAFLSTLALAAATLEKIALEIRHLQRTEVLEAEEPFSPGQKGSSAMPHKRNPILCERICGLARILRANALVSLENVALWHERDISHSSAERVIFPDSCITLHYMLAKTSSLIENLIVYPEKMRSNLELTRGLVFSQRVLLALTEKNVPRDKAYRLVQRNAMNAWNAHAHFLDLLLADREIRGILSEKEIKECFDLARYLRHVDDIFKRFGRKKR